MNKIKQRPPGALWLSELKELIRTADDETTIYHCSTAFGDKGPTAIPLKKCKLDNKWLNTTVPGWGGLSLDGVHLINGNNWNDAYIFDNYWLAYAYRIVVDKTLNDKQKSS